MPTLYDVPVNLLLARLGDRLRRESQIRPPAWAHIAKTGSHAERQPQSPAWWYVRCASLLRKIYLRGPIGLSDLEAVYGGSRRRSHAPRRHRDAGGSSVRKPLQQLEAAGLVTKLPAKGRIVTSKGRSLLDHLSGEIFKELLQSTPSLARYG